MFPQAKDGADCYVLRYVIGLVSHKAVIGSTRRFVVMIGGCVCVWICDLRSHLHLFSFGRRHAGDEGMYMHGEGYG